MLDVALAAAVAYYGSDGQQPALVPINQHDLEKCLRCVNRGINMFIASAPAEGWRWMNRIMEVTLGTVQTEGTVDSGSSTTLIDSTLSTTYDTNNEITGYYVYNKTKEIYGAITGYTTSTGTCFVAAWLDYDDEVSTLVPVAGDSYSITDVKTIGGDKARYPLSQDFHRVKREVTVTTGYPTRAAVRPWRKRRWELIVDPSPTAGDTLIFPYRVGFSELQMKTGTSNAGATTSLTDADLANLYPTDYFKGWYIYLIDGTGKGSYAKCTAYAAATGVFTVADWLSIDGSAGGTDPSTSTSYYVEPANNKHPAGQQHDDAIRAACLAMAEREFDDVNKGYMAEFIERALPSSHKIDARSAPRKLGMILPGTRPVRYKRTWTDVTYD